MARFIHLLNCSLGEAPQALAEKDPALFSHIAANYPKVMQPV